MNGANGGGVGGTQQFLPLIDPKSKFSKQSNFEKQQSNSLAEA
jgi:hypothetical protein